jgi:Ca2+-binding RTX toxin-like protein
VGPFAIASRAALLAGAFVLIAFLSAGPAFAGEVAVSGDSTITYAATAGEHNDVSVTASVDGVTVDDAGAGVAAGRGCDPLGPHAARCYPHGDLPFIDVRAGDENDVVRAVVEPGATASFSLSGGSGDDHLQAAAQGSFLDGGPGADTLEGGPGGDSLMGGPGSDTLTGGGGNDSITPDDDAAPPASDVVDGGPGSDTVSYAGRTTPVDVDLERPGGNGGPGENDTIRGIENVTSGGGSDHLRGDEQANVLSSTGSGQDRPGQHDVVEGRGGDDRIDGSSGADVLSGGSGGDEISGNGGADTLRGGPGDDGIDLEDGRPGSLRCGRGDDLVNYPPASDLIPAECETVQVDGVFFLVRSRLGRAAGASGGAGVRTVEISWFAGFPELPCRVVAVLSRPGVRGGARLGRGGVRLPAGNSYRATIKVLLTAARRRVFGSRKPVPVRLLLEGHSSCKASDRNVDSGAGGFTLLSR